MPASLRPPSSWRPGTRRVVAIAAGAVIALGQPPVSVPIFALLGLAAVTWILRGQPPRTAAFLGWLAGGGYFTAGLFWIVEPFLVDAATHGWLAPFALAGLAWGLAVFWIPAAALAAHLTARPIPFAIAFAAALAGADILRAHIFTGFPWALHAYTWLETPVLQTAALTGPHGLSFLTILAAGLFAAGRPGMIAGTALIAALILPGLFPRPAPVKDRPLIRLVQPNAPQHLRWDPAHVQGFYNEAIAQTRAPGTPAAVIWPETAVPWLLGTRPDMRADVTMSLDIPVIIGARRTENGRWFNSLAVFTPGGGLGEVYDKHHLVPFGEYMPVRPLFVALGIPGLGADDLAGFYPGAEPHLVTAPGLDPFLPLICYESIFPHQLHRPDDRPGWIVNITNDAWFGNLAGPYQHLAHARFRAVEQGLPVARAANTGVSAMIDPFGQVTAEVPLNTTGFVDAPLPAPLAPTLYARSGDMPTIAALLAILGALALSRRRIAATARG